MKKNLGRLVAGLVIITVMFGLIFGFAMGVEWLITGIREESLLVYFVLGLIVSIIAYLIGRGVVDD